MSSSSSSCMELGHQSSKMLLLRPNSSKIKLMFRNPLAFLCPHHHRRHHHNHIIVAPKFSISSSLNPLLFTSGNVIAAAAATGTASSSAHAAVTSALAHVAVTAVAIASGACLSTKVDFLWPRLADQPDALIFDGVDVTGYPIFLDAKVQKAIAFARKAHLGQLRKTGDAYLTHCIHTGRILAALIPSNGNRAIDTVVAGILHDVIDDTCESLHNIEEEFGADVAKLVASVSKLSYINQLLRRRRRSNVNQGALGPEEANNLRVMLLGMVDDPRVVLIKLADRLHNMRTIHALSSRKAQAVAQETLAVWCSLASRLGVWALKAELEDLCFAVLQPQTFRQMRAELAFMWNPSNKPRNLRRLFAKANLVEPLHKSIIVPDFEVSMESEEDEATMKDLLEAVLPFDLLLDRGKRIKFLNNVTKCSKGSQTKPKVVTDASIALASLAVCEEALERELFISTSYVPGMEVTLSSRLKSLYSIYCKMKRKDIGIKQVYDARALRVVVGDKNGRLHGAAVKCCYSLLNTVHRLWTPIDGEFDDYIVNPKLSGYQSLHTAIQGPDSSPLEVQIRTQTMHEHAEYGLAAHWLYKEAENKVVQTRAIHTKMNPSLYQSKGLEDEASVDDDEFQKYSSLKKGHPVLRVEGSHLLASVVVSVDKGGRELLVAVSFGLEASEAVADRRSSFQIKRWEVYANLYKKVSDQWWFAPGHGDWCTCLEKYILCRDGIYHKQDQFQRLLPTFIQVIDLTEQEEIEYWTVVSAVFEGKQVTSIPLNSSFSVRRSSESPSSTPIETSINNKVKLLRTMLQWEEQVQFEAGLRETKNGAKPGLGEVVIVCWPDGDIMRMRSGSTAADIAIIVGLEGKLVLVNGQLALPHTELKDGDIVEVKTKYVDFETLKIGPAWACGTRRLKKCRCSKVPNSIMA
ncbi:HD/PDEase domain [Macleaya cordata]|uniref:GTP diphosphokinase n=1 Tax=Macleaya cordata TaxID=56857 RepID=A0A200QNL1_MACCD|nr:HD/PDEase domain [Macleaya cordata]